MMWFWLKGVSIELMDRPVRFTIQCFQGGVSWQLSHLQQQQDHPQPQRHPQCQVDDVIGMKIDPTCMPAFGVRP